MWFQHHELHYIIESISSEDFVMCKSQNTFTIGPPLITKGFSQGFLFWGSRGLSVGFQGSLMKKYPGVQTKYEIYVLWNL